MYSGAYCFLYPSSPAAVHLQLQRVWRRSSRVRSCYICSKFELFCLVGEEKVKPHLLHVIAFLHVTALLLVRLGLGLGLGLRLGLFHVISLLLVGLGLGLGLRLGFLHVISLLLVRLGLGLGLLHVISLLLVGLGLGLGLGLRLGLLHVIALLLVACSQALCVSKTSATVIDICDVL